MLNPTRPTMCARPRAAANAAASTHGTNNNCVGPYMGRNTGQTRGCLCVHAITHLTPRRMGGAQRPCHPQGKRGEGRHMVQGRDVVYKGHGAWNGHGTSDRQLPSPSKARPMCALHAVRHHAGENMCAQHRGCALPHPKCGEHGQSDQRDILRSRQRRRVKTHARDRSQGGMGVGHSPIKEKNQVGTGHRPRVSDTGTHHLVMQHVARAQC